MIECKDDYTHPTLSLKRSIANSWLEKSSKETLDIARSNTDNKFLGMLGSAIEAMHYENNYGTKLECNELLTSSLLLSSFRKREMHETLPHNVDKSKIEL